MISGEDYHHFQTYFHKKYFVIFRTSFLMINNCRPMKTVNNLKWTLKLKFTDEAVNCEVFRFNWCENKLLSWRQFLSLIPSINSFQWTDSRDPEILNKRNK